MLKKIEPNRDGVHKQQNYNILPIISLQLSYYKMGNIDALKCYK